MAIVSISLVYELYMLYHFAWGQSKIQNTWLTLFERWFPVHGENINKNNMGKYMPSISESAKQANRLKLSGIIYI